MSVPILTTGGSSDDRNGSRRLSIIPPLRLLHKGLVWRWNQIADTRFASMLLRKPSIYFDRNEIDDPFLRCKKSLWVSSTSMKARLNHLSP